MGPPNLSSLGSSSKSDLLRTRALCLSLSPDGGTLAVGTVAATAAGGVGEIQLWNTKAQKIIRRRRCPDNVQACAISPDGKQLAYSGGFEGEVFVEPLDGSGEPKRAPRPGPPNRKGRVRCQGTALPRGLRHGVALSRAKRLWRPARDVRSRKAGRGPGNRCEGRCDQAGRLALAGSCRRRVDRQADGPGDAATVFQGSGEGPGGSRDRAPRGGDTLLVLGPGPAGQALCDCRGNGVAEQHLCLPVDERRGLSESCAISAATRTTSPRSASRRIASIWSPARPTARSPTGAWRTWSKGRRLMVPGGPSSRWPTHEAACRQASPSGRAALP